MILIMQNFGSNPKISCKIITEEVITISFLYLVKISFIINNICHQECNKLQAFLLQAEINLFFLYFPEHRNYLLQDNLFVLVPG